MRRFVLLTCTVLTMGGCGASYNVDPAQISAVGAGSAPSKDTMMPLLEQQVRATLKDPSSAQFNWPNDFVAGAHQPLMAKPIYGWVTCGTVNAKNSYGGYTGAQAVLVVVRDGQVVFTEVDKGTGRPLIAGYCRLYGVPV